MEKVDLFKFKLANTKVLMVENFKGIRVTNLFNDVIWIKKIADYKSFRKDLYITITTKNSQTSLLNNIQH